jgi:hypothetical protein
MSRSCVERTAHLAATALMNSITAAGIRHVLNDIGAHDEIGGRGAGIRKRNGLPVSVRIGLLQERQIFGTSKPIVS